MNSWGYILIGILIVALFIGYKIMEWFDEDDTDYIG